MIHLNPIKSCDKIRENEEEKMKVLIASKNPAKIQGAKEAFEEYFEEVCVEGIPTNSDVPEQPVNQQIYEGATNRVKNLKKYAKENGIEADYYIAIESGITNQLGSWIIVNVACIEGKNGINSIGTSPGFPVPEKYVDEIIQKDLSVVMERLSKKKDLRFQAGGIGFLTHDVITRHDLTRDAFCMALTKFINGEMWQ